MADKKLALIIEVINKGSRGFKSAIAGVKSFAGGVSNAGKKIARGFGIGIAAIIAGVAAAGFALKKGAEEAADYGDSFGKMAKRLGANAQELQRINFALDLSGVENASKNLEKAMLKMGRTMFDASKGLSTAVDALDILGITMEELEGITPVERFEKFAVALSKIEDPTKRAALAQEIFGKAGAKLIPFLEDGAEAMAKLKAEGDKYAPILTDQEIKNAEEFVDAATRLKAAWKAVRIEFSSKFHPILTQIMNEFAKFTANIRGNGDLASWGERSAEAIGRFYNFAKETIPKIAKSIKDIFGTEESRSAALDTIKDQLLSMAQVVGKTFGDIFGSAAFDAIYRKLNPVGMWFSDKVGNINKDASKSVQKEIDKGTRAKATRLERENLDRGRYAKAIRLERERENNKDASKSVQKEIDKGTRAKVTRLEGENLDRGISAKAIRLERDLYYSNPQNLVNSNTTTGLNQETLLETNRLLQEQIDATKGLVERN